MPPVLAESICLASLPGVTVPVRAVLPFDERVLTARLALDSPQRPATAAIAPKTTER